MIEDHLLVRKLNDLQFAMQLIREILPDGETLEEMIERIVLKSLKNSQENA